MNIYEIKERYLVMTFYNLAFLGYGRNGKGLKIDGHYTVVFDPVEFRFIAWKHGDYPSSAPLTSYKDVKQRVNKLSQVDRKFMNDEIYDELSSSERYSYGMVHRKSNTIFEDDGYHAELKEVKAAIKKLKEGKGERYYHRRISPMVQYGDLVKDMENGEIFYACHLYDMRYINMHEKQYKIIRRCIPSNMNLNRFTGVLETLDEVGV